MWGKVLPTPPVPAGSAEPLSITRLVANAGASFALGQIDLEVGEGELVAVAGEPGSGRSTLVRCLAGDLVPTRGQILICGRRLSAGTAAAERQGVAVVWQQPELCENLDVAANLLLGLESHRLMLSEARFHATAAAILERLSVPIASTTELVGELSVAQRQLLVIARAIHRNPRVLVLDEPTEPLGALETQKVEELLADLRRRGTAIVLVSRDFIQMFRLADRIVALRHGRMAGEIIPSESHPDELAALVSGQPVDSTARRQLTRLHGLAGRLVSADPSSSLSLILSALGGALGIDRASIHVVRGAELHGAAWLGFGPDQTDAWNRLAIGESGSPPARAAALASQAVQDGIWSVPVSDADGVCAVITVFHPREPQRDELDLLSLYAGYAAGAIERDRLLDQVTARNRVLETIREMLETLTGTVPVADGLPVALGSLRHGLRAAQVGLMCQNRSGQAAWRAVAEGAGARGDDAVQRLRLAAECGLNDGPQDGAARELGSSSAGPLLGVGFVAPEGPAVLVASWEEATAGPQEMALLENAAHSLRLALEREEAAVAHQEAAALRRSREMQRDFLSRLSHELRTPLTAIRGYASSLLQTDVTWDGASEQRFLERIAAESSRMGRLVGDLLDFSAIESGVMRLQLDWCEICLVAEAAVACLPAGGAPRVKVLCDEALPPIWADHDRLEQVFVNLLSNALRHNPPGTLITIEARAVGHCVEIQVVDDGVGLPRARRHTPFEAARRPRTRQSGSGLGLSIAKGIVEAHGGTIELVPAQVGTTFRIVLPVEAALAAAQDALQGTDADQLRVLPERAGSPLADRATRTPVA
ncbi:MAG TPA: ATP-binding cassette domain-containing protein [Solirubrobacteraceae bacterium]|nr:ATP-binding cassette domain-containing protein [Solirubrobacteraceae bacterium]